MAKAKNGKVAAKTAEKKMYKCSKCDKTSHDHGAIVIHQRYCGTKKAKKVATKTEEKK